MTSRVVRAAVGAFAVSLVGLSVSAVAVGGIDAEVTSKDHDEHGTYVIATTDVGGLEFQRYVPVEDWSVVQEGDTVVYDVLTGETSIYTWEQGTLIWRG